MITIVDSVDLDDSGAGGSWPTRCKKVKFLLRMGNSPKNDTKSRRNKGEN